MREYPNVSIERLPRMADFAKWATARAQAQCEPAGQFERDYQVNVERQNEEAIAGSATATLLLAFFEDRRKWTSTVDDLLTELQRIGDVKRITQKDIPGSPQALGRRLREIRPNLEALGLEVTFSTHHHPRTVTIRKVDPK